MDRRQQIRRHYQPRIRPGRAGHEILDWASPRSQQARFAVLADNVDLAGMSLLDVGCGIGDLWAWLEARGLDVRYTGVDLLDAMVAEAADRHPGARFLCGDIFASPPLEPGRFDVVFCSGALNLNLGNNAEFLPRAAARMFELCREAAVINLLHRRARTGDPRYFHHDPEEVLRALAHLPARLRVVDDYLPNDFTVICTPSASG